MKRNNNIPRWFLRLIGAVAYLELAAIGAITLLLFTTRI